MATDHLTSLQLEDVADGLVAAEATLHLSVCEQCSGELARMTAARAQFQRQVVGPTLPLVQARIRRPSPWAWLIPVALVPVAAALLVTLAPELTRRQGPDLRVKGASTVRAFARRGGNVFEVQEGMTLQQGDQLRFEIKPGGLSFLLVGFVDSQGHASIIFPRDGTQSGAIDPVGTFTPPGSAELDDACGPERVFALLSRQPFAAEAFRRELSALSDRGPDAVRAARSLSALPADALWTRGWEKCQ
jgi:hypothetical protein